MKPFRFLLCFAPALLAACAGPQVAAPPGAPSAPSAATPARPNVNLSGYPLEFRQGYADGCNSAKGALVRNELRMKGDIQYAAGWRDGNDICRKR